MTQKPAFKKPSQKPRDEPAGLDGFASGAPAALAPAASTPPSEPEEEPEIHGMNVRFTATEKALLKRLAKADARSQHQVLKRLLAPIFREAARTLEG